LGIPFCTPEQFFLGDKTQVVRDKFDPSWHLPSNLGGKPISKSSKTIWIMAIRCLSFLTRVIALRMHPKPVNVELVVLVGLPGAGKTTYYGYYLQPLGYERVNEDELGGFGDCVKVVEQLLLGGKSVR
jgi:bifunctional polynucleotide phosphatase/kinase